MAKFPAGTNGKQLDAIARAPLWAAGLDFAHGTGHGVGHVLSVHEGPASISKRGDVALEVGMVLSNEPGYYQTGDWGIRVENLIVVTPANAIPVLIPILPIRVSDILCNLHDCQGSINTIICITINCYCVCRL